MLGRVSLLRTDVSEELGVSFIRVIRISELETTLALTSNRHTLQQHGRWANPRKSSHHLDNSPAWKKQIENKKLLPGF
jgi:hypothetical protein